MRDEDWFRNAAWDDAAKQLFRKKLSRAKQHKNTYLRTKAAAIADEHLADALALLDEYMAADEENVPSGYYAKSMLHLKVGNIDEALVLMDRAIGKSGMDMHAPALLEFVFLVGLYKRLALYQRALEVLNALDDDAHRQVGRPFNRNFEGNAGAAFILYALGQKDDAQLQAKAALELALATAGPFAKHPQWGRVPQLPKDFMDRLIVIAGIWDDSKLGPRLEI
jgi:tetratricopeptide (TPR) repeat protein